jgi:hypothetical protein
MSVISRPNIVELDAYSDPQLEYSGNNGLYSRFTNALNTPILKAKSIQVLSVNMVNTSLQLNDQSQLMFFYYVSNTIPAIRNATNLRCVRLLPSTFVPYSGFTAFTRNRYFNSVQELVAALNLAASTGGDSATFNPRWVANQVSFSYDTASRKISITSSGGSVNIAPAPADDSLVQDFLNNTGSFSAQRPVMNWIGSSNTYASSIVQPYVIGQSMNARIGFAMGFLNRGQWWTSSSQQGCATMTGVPAGGVAMEADASPILLGAQNVGVYITEATGSGYDSMRNKNLAINVPISVAPLNVMAYNATGVESKLMSVPQELYQLSVELRDDLGLPFLQPPSYNVQITLAVKYDDDE